MEIKKVHYIIWLFVVISVNLTLIDTYSQDTSPKPSHQAAIDAFSKGDYEKALGEFSILLKSFSKDPLYKYYSGVCLVKLNRDPADASAFLRDALNGPLDIKSIPDDAWFYLGRSQQMLGMFQEAIRSYNSFEDKAGKKTARNYDIYTYIRECDEGRGKLSNAEYQKENTISKTFPDTGAAGGKNASENAGIQPAVKAIPQKQELPLEYDKVMSEAMKYQVKADSLNALISESKKEYDKLPASQKGAAKVRISEMESLAAEYQKIADEKFGFKGALPPAKQDVVIPPSAPDIKKGKEIFSLFSIESNPALIRNQKINIDPELPAGLIYRIQMGVFSKPPDPSFFKGISPVAGFRIPGTENIRYFAGMFRKMDDASRALLSVKQMGFKDSFITAVSDGKAVSTDRALLLENEWSQKPLVIISPSQTADGNSASTLIFRVEVSRSAKPVSNEVAEMYKKMAGNRGFEIISTDDGTLVYLIGKFITFESASEYADLLIRNGYRESKVAAYLGSREIPVETARQLFEKQE